MGNAKAKIRTAAEIIAAGVKEYGLHDPLEREDERASRHNAVRGLMVRLGVYPQFCQALDGGWTDATPHPADEVRAQTIEECAKMVEETVTTTQSFEQTDHNDLYTGNYERREVTYLKWGSRARDIASAIRALAPAPPTESN